MHTGILSLESGE